MKAFERIFLYTVLAILVFYVFLVDGNVESQEAIQEEIRVRMIEIVNDEGQPVIVLLADKNGGTILVGNKNDISVVRMGANEDGSGVEVIYNKDGTPGVKMTASASGGTMSVNNQDGTPVAMMGGRGNGVIEVLNESGKVIGSLP